jgi:hypothetical protein
MISEEGWGTYPSNTRERGVAAPPRRPYAWATQDFEDLEAPATFDPNAMEPSGSIEAPLLGQRLRPSRGAFDELFLPKPSAAPTDDVRTTTPLSAGSMLAVAPVEVVELSPQPVIDDDAYFHPVGAINAIMPEEQGATWTFRRARARAQRSWVVAGLVAIVTPLVLLGCIIGAGQLASGRAEPRVARTVESTKDPLAVSVNALKRRPPTPTRALRAPKGTRPAPARILPVRR